MTTRVRITDVSPRDGLQNEPGVIASADKLRLIEALCMCGLDEVEITSFVSPKWVPQLADAGEVVTGVRTFAEGVRQVAGTMPDRMGARDVLPTFSVLVPNEKGFDRALGAHESGLPLKVALFTAASETFSQKNTNTSIAGTIERFAPVVEGALAAEMSLRLYVSCAVACPFEGPIGPAAVRRVVDLLDELVETQAQRTSLDIDLGDTIGVAEPNDITALLDEFDDAERARLTLHLHDTHGRAADCVRTALDLGVASFDGSVAGIGGCPYASTPDSRAPGNLDTLTLVRTVHDAGFETGVDLDELEHAARIAREVVSKGAHA
ncbi:MAG: hydroxymethylglutaryl-CoA lyase [Planctomycetota bacterium]